MGSCHRSNRSAYNFVIYKYLSEKNNTFYSFQFTVSGFATPEPHQSLEAREKKFVLNNKNFMASNGCEYLVSGNEIPSGG